MFDIQVNDLWIGREQCSSLCQKRSERILKLSENIFVKPCKQNSFKDPSKVN